MATKKRVAPNRVEEDFDDTGMLKAFKNDVEVTGEFQTRKKNKDKNTIELSTDNGRTWEVVSYVKIGKANFDETYDKEFDAKEVGKDQMVGKHRVIKGNV